VAPAGLFWASFDLVFGARKKKSNNFSKTRGLSFCRIRFFFWGRAEVWRGVSRFRGQRLLCYFTRGARGKKQPPKHFARLRQACHRPAGLGKKGAWKRVTGAHGGFFRRGPPKTKKKKLIFFFWSQVAKGGKTGRGRGGGGPIFLRRPGLGGGGGGGAGGKVTSKNPGGNGRGGRGETRGGEGSTPRGGKKKKKNPGGGPVSEGRLENITAGGRFYLATQKKPTPLFYPHADG